MKAFFDEMGFSSALVIFFGVALIVLLRSASRVLLWLPMTRSRFARVRQWMPVIATGFVLVYLVIAVQWLLNDFEWAALTPVAVLGLVLLAAWRGVRDATDGLFLRATGACREGDYVQVGGVDGRVRDVGWRFMTIETSEGHIATVPYSQALGSTFRRLPEVKHGLLHVFRLSLPASVPLPSARRAVLRAALLCPWCVPKQNARIRAISEGRELEITLSLIDADHATESEEVVAEALSALGNASA